MPEVKLTLFERRVLANQYRILEKIDPAGASDHAQTAEALESGYTLQYPDVFDNIRDELSQEGCRLVWDSMALYDALQRSAASHPDRLDRDRDLTFPGFDGNNETHHMAYARFITDRLNRFSNLQMANGLNSHTEMVPEYRAMLRKWQGELSKRYDLTRDEIISIIEAGRG